MRVLLCSYSRPSVQVDGPWPLWTPPFREGLEACGCEVIEPRTVDLIEPFRPVLVEALALDLFSHQILNADHFEPRNGGVYLNEPGRKKYILQYERRMERQFLSECVEHRTTLRQQLEQQAVLYKAALADPATFQPFLMN